MTMAIWKRTCQECGHTQEDKEPKDTAGPNWDRYANRKCKECKSEALDFGSYQHPGAPEDHTKNDPDENLELCEECGHTLMDCRCM